MAVSIDEKTRELIYKMSDAFFSMFSAYNPIAVEQAIRMLDKKEKKIISLLYGLDGEHCLDYDEIAERFNMDVDDVDETIEKGISKLKEILIKKRFSLKGVNRYSELIEKYSEEKVFSALESLDDEHKNLINEYYVKGDCSLDKLAKKYNMKTGAVYSKLNIGIKKIQEIIENKIANIFYSKFEGFSKEEVDEKLNEIDNTSKQIIKLYYGLNCKRKSVSELSEIYHMSGQNVYYVMNTNIDVILKKLTNSNVQKSVVKKGRKRENFYSIFEGFSVEQVNDAMKYINEKQKNMLVLYYGLNGEDGKSTKEIGKCLGHSAISVRDMIVGAMIELIAILGYGKEDNQIVTNRK